MSNAFGAWDKMSTEVKLIPKTSIYEKADKLSKKLQANMAFMNHQPTITLAPIKTNPKLMTDMKLIHDQSDAKKLDDVTLKGSDTTYNHVSHAPNNIQYGLLNWDLDSRIEVENVTSPNKQKMCYNTDHLKDMVTPSQLSATKLSHKWKANLKYLPIETKKSPISKSDYKHKMVKVQQIPNQNRLSAKLKDNIRYLNVDTKFSIRKQVDVKSYKIINKHELRVAETLKKGNIPKLPEILEPFSILNEVQHAKRVETMDEEKPLNLCIVAVRKSNEVNENHREVTDTRDTVSIDVTSYTEGLCSDNISNTQTTADVDWTIANLNQSVDTKKIKQKDSLGKTAIEPICVENRMPTITQASIKSLMEPDEDITQVRDETKMQMISTACNVQEQLECLDKDTMTDVDTHHKINKEEAEQENNWLMLHTILGHYDASHQVYQRLLQISTTSGVDANVLVRLFLQMLAMEVDPLGCWTFPDTVGSTYQISQYCNIQGLKETAVHVGEQIVEGFTYCTEQTD